MKSFWFLSGCVLFGCSTIATTVAAFSSSGLLNCSFDSTHALKWTSIQNRDEWGYLSFTNQKDSQGYPIATTLEEDGNPAKPVPFQFVTCAAPNGKPGYMGYGSGKTKNGKHVGHLQLKSNPKLCLTATSITQKSRLVLKPCHLEDSEFQRYQFFSPSINYINMGIVRNPFNSSSLVNGAFYLDQRTTGSPLMINFTTEPSKYALYWEPRPEK